MGSLTKQIGTTADSGSGGAVTWSNTDNVKVLDGNYATASHLSIPDDREVKLILDGVVSGNDKADPSGIGYPTTITLRTYCHSYDEKNYTYDDANYNYDSYYDTWGLTLRGSDVNKSTFGLSFQTQGVSVSHRILCTNLGYSLHPATEILGITADVYKGRTGNVANLDFIQMTVYYQDANFSRIQSITNISTLTF